MSYFVDRLNQKTPVMKKLLIVFTALTFVMAACNNNKTAGKETETKTETEKDKEDTRDEEKKTSNNDDDDNNSRSGWSAKEVNDFVSSCVGEAEKGMTRSAAERYCECMQERLDKKYPVPADAASVDLESEEMQQMVKDCLF